MDSQISEAPPERGNVVSALGKHNNDSTAGFIPVTLFPNQQAFSKHEYVLDWKDIADRLTNPQTYPSKADLPWLKLASFGEQRTDKNCLRHNLNVTAVGGIEGDYDQGKVSLEEAASKAQEARVKCLFYPSASHTPESPRWRVLAPFSAPYSASVGAMDYHRKKMLARIDNVLGGVLAPESRTLSQAYYFGKVEGVEYKTIVIEGDYIDLREDLHADVQQQSTGAGSSSDFGEFDYADAVQKIITGENYWRSTVSLAMHYVAIGNNRTDAIKQLQTIYQQAKVINDTDKWQARYDAIPGIVDSAIEKKKSCDADTSAFMEKFIANRPSNPQASEQAPETVLDALKLLSSTNRLDEMEENLNNDSFVFPGLALMGQITLFYAWPNTGKTLFFLKFIVDGILEGTINPDDVFYINADDDYKGLYAKSRIAERYGFHMISPAEANVSPADILEMLAAIAIKEDINGKVIILDTLKKFTDMMDKRAQAQLYEVLRRLVVKGATVIIAGHANKHKDLEGNLIYEGTSDTLNDIDCAYSMYRMTPKEDETQVVEFRREKDRGDNVARVSYQYTKRQGMRYMEIVNSVKPLASDQAQIAAKKKYVEDLRDRYESERLFVAGLLQEHEKMNQTDIMASIKGHPLEGEITRTRVGSALGKLTGIEWTVKRGEKNAKIFRLVGSEEDAYRRATGG